MNNLEFKILNNLPATPIPGIIYIIKNQNSEYFDIFRYDENLDILRRILNISDLDNSVNALKGNVPEQGDTLEKLHSLITTSNTTQMITKTSFPGELEVVTGTIRWYPYRDVTFSKIQATLSTPGDQDVTFLIKKNGSLLSSFSMTPEDHNKFWTYSIPLTTNDYITVDITEIGDTVKGSDLIITFIE